MTLTLYCMCKPKRKVYLRYEKGKKITTINYVSIRQKKLDIMLK